MVGMFRRQVVRAPDATAVVAADRTLSYGELDARASAVACGLRDRGLRAAHYLARADPRGGALVVWGVCAVTPPHA
ncbi:AMP-binding protein, partial [Streptomyces anulatus]|uniref:AMP-binding protein n=1 Tax=Streptomyces anulatus TaxID=1892 RepID=UPI00366A1838